MFLVVHFSGWLVAKLLPAPRLSDLTDWSLDELKEYYRRTDRVVRIAHPAIMACVVGLAVCAVYEFCYARPYREPGAVLVLAPLTPWLTLPVLAIFMGGVGDTAFYVWLRAVLGGRRYRNYVAYLSNRDRRRWHVARVSVLGSCLLCVPSAIGLFLFLDRWVVFTGAEVVNNPTWTIGETVRRPYTDVVGVYEVGWDRSFGKLVRSWHVRIAFADGSEWTLPDNGERGDRERLEAAVRLVSTVTGKPVVKVDTRGE
jgi:hypothetical protein